MFTYLVITICLLLAVFSTWKEYKSGKPYLVWRIVATLALIFSLGCIALPISYPGEKKSGQNEAVLLTEGFEKDSLENFQGDSILTTDETIKKQFPKAKLIALNQLNLIQNTIKKLHVFGFGLTREEIADLDSLPIVFHPAKMLTGLTNINWTDNIKTSQIFSAQGTFKNYGAKQVKLLLKGSGVNLDSAIISAESTSQFDLRNLPKLSGKALYQLLAIAGSDTINNETLPVFIEPVKPLKILLIASAPGFEYKYLKQWLVDNGFAVAIRTTISKDKFSTEFVNTETVNLNSLSPILLDKFDLLITDLSSIRSLNTPQNTILKKQVFEKGMGLIVRADSDFKNKTWVENEFSLKKSKGNVEKPAYLYLATKPSQIKISDLGQYFINYQEGTQVLVNDSQNRELAGLALAGTGKIAITTLSNSYAWMLNGNKTDYGVFWSSLIAKTSRHNEIPQKWQLENGIPLENNESQLKLQSAKQPIDIIADSVNLSPVQNSNIPFQWQTNWWPAKTGWQTLIINKYESGQLFVYKKDAWKSIALGQKLARTKKYAESTNSDLSVTKLIHIKMSIPVPKLYFYVLLLMAYTWLWLIGKRVQKG